MRVLAAAAGVPAIEGLAVGLDEIVAVTAVQQVVISASDVAVEGAAVAGRATESLHGIGYATTRRSRPDTR